MAAAGSWKVRAAGAAGAVVVSALLRTVRFDIRIHPDTQHLLGAAGSAAYGFWHGRMLLLAFLHRDQGIAVMVSQHRDGEAIARVAADLGYVTARGSTTRGGTSGLRALIRRASEGRSLALTPDGPRGPREVAQPGIVTAARLSGLPLVPVGVAVDRCWRMKSWDQFQIPKPFSTVFVRYGAPLWVEDESDAILDDVQAALARLTSAADEAAQSVPTRDDDSV